MGGRPVWLASCSVMDLKREDPVRGGPLKLPTHRWPSLVRAEAERQLRLALAGVGDDSMQRCFRMCVTLCVHRAVTDAELAGLPADWKCVAPRDLAGTPLEVLWTTPAVPKVLSAEPCRAPLRRPIRGAEHLEMYIPIGCGRCDTCQARQASQAEALKKHEAWLAAQSEAPKLASFSNP